MRLKNISASTQAEMIGVTISVKSKYVNIVKVYSRSGEVLTDLTTKYSQLSGYSFILGDFNLHNSLWGCILLLSS